MKTYTSQNNKAKRYILLIFVIVIIFSLIIVASPTLQKLANAQSGGSKWALLVGIDQYDDPNISKLNFSVADVTDFRDALIDPSIGNFPSDHVYLMTDKSTGAERPTNSNVIFRLDKLIDRIKPEDTFIFYFSGHGITRGDKSFLLSVNADPRTLNTLELTAIPLEKLQAMMRQIKARQILFICDACRNDPEKGKGDIDNPLTQQFAKGIAVVGSGSSNYPVGSATLFACSLGERAYEWQDKGHGVFSYFLLGGLKGKAADSDGTITMNKLAEYVQNEVTRWSQENLPSGKKQTPWLDQSGSARIVLAKVQRSEVKEISNIATLTVSTIPPGARVYVGTKQVGVAPVEVNIDTGILGEKTVEVGLELEGYVSKTAKWTLKRGMKESWTDVVLQPLPSSPPVTPPQQPKPPRQGQGIQNLPRTKISPIDGAEMVLIPAGEFLMGSPEGEGSSDEYPQHTVDLDAFYIDKYEVTNAQYKKFVDATGHSAPEFWNDGRFNKTNQPVVGVSWFDAEAYCKWAGKRLPTEAEWEKAARGGLEGKKYPWGDDDPSGRANYLSSETKAVGSYTPNRYGLYDMAGNVWEWCADWYDSNYYNKSPKYNPKGPNSGSSKVLRGGSGFYGDFFLRAATRGPVHAPDFAYYFIGFRCVSSVP